jgi:hypothetical protein
MFLQSVAAAGVAEPPAAVAPTSMPAAAGVVEKSLTMF